MEQIFLTRRSWHSIGGIPGLSLTIQDAGVPQITLHGPTKLRDIFHGMRKFVVLKNLKVDAPECNQNGFYDDIVLKVHYLPLRYEIYLFNALLNILCINFKVFIKSFN